MQGNCSYYNPTKLYFGDESLNFLKDELKGYGPVVLLNYGSGSVKRNVKMYNIRLKKCVEIMVIRLKSWDNSYSRFIKETHGFANNLQICEFSF